MVQRPNFVSGPSIVSTIVSGLPPEAEVTRVEYEGPRIALYTKNPSFLLKNNQILSAIVNSVKRRLVVRTDTSIRKPEPEAREILANLLPKEAEASAMFFDDALGEVILEVRRPQLLTSESGFDPAEVAGSIGWRIRVRKAPGIQSTSYQHIYYALKSGAEERQAFYREAGERIFRPRISLGEEASILTLGGFREVGRSCLLVTTRESRILLDCGIKPGTSDKLEAYPRLDWAGVSLDEIDAVVISHAHLDHIGFLPVLYKYGYKGPIYCTEPTLPLITLLLMDYLKVASMEGNPLLFDARDAREVIRRGMPLPYGTVTDITPDTKLVLNNAGHILGSATVHLHIGDGAHNIVYTGDYKFGRTRLLESTNWHFPRVETLITESTYGAKEDVMPSREEVELVFVHTLNETLREGGKVLIPVPAVGRAQEIMLVIDEYMRQGLLVEAPVLIEGMITEATAIHMAHHDYLARDLWAKILEQDQSPFLSEYFTVIEHQRRDEAFQEGPAIIMATSGMLEGGPVIQYFNELAPNEKNKLVFVSYQVPGTLGRRILDGAREASLPDEGGKIRVVNVRAKVERIEGFSGHSDYNQIIRFIAQLRPKLHQIIVNHGERRKVENIAYTVGRIFRIPTFQPGVQEALRVY